MNDLLICPECGCAPRLDDDPRQVPNSPRSRWAYRCPNRCLITVWFPNGPEAQESWNRVVNEHLAARAAVPLSDSAGYGYTTLVPHTEGIKHDADKPRMDLLPPEMLEAVAKVLAFGAAKYEAHNWRKGMAWGRYYAAALRHMNAWNRGEDTDPESGLPHLAHAACCLAFLIASQESGHGTDDRFTIAKTEVLQSICVKCKDSL